MNRHKHARLTVRGVATRPITDIDAYYRKLLSRFVTQTGILMRPIFNAAKALPANKKRVAFADGVDEPALRPRRWSLTMASLRRS
jgi:malate dehydrogenase (oxaloacetate-decarboxylating)(NADP+)